MKHASSFPKNCKRFSINFTEDIQFQVYNRKPSECPDTASLTWQLKIELQNKIEGGIILINKSAQSLLFSVMFLEAPILTHK